MAYVYIYYDPRTTPTIPIYVGKGKGKRMSFHKNNAKNPILKGKLAKIKALGLEPIIERVKDNISDQEAIKLEIELIAKYGRIDLGTGTLCNLTDGGEGTVGRIPSEATKKLWSEQRKGKKQTPAQYKANCNRKMTDEHKKRITQALTGRKLSEEHREKLIKMSTGRIPSQKTRELWSKQRKGKTLTKEHIENSVKSRMKNFIHKKVYCINNNTTYNSLNEAANKLNLKATAITAVANGSRKHHKGYIFNYVN